MRSRLTAIVAGAMALGIGSLLVASPAAAATLPPGQRVNVIQAQNGPDTFGSQMFQASPVDAALTAPGPLQNAQNVGAVDVNDDGLGWAVSTDFDSQGNAFTAELFRANANTGVLSAPLTIVGPGEDYQVDSCDALDLSPTGVILVGCYGTVSEEPLTWIGTLLIANDEAVLTPLLTLGQGIDDPIYWNAIAVNPVNGQVWAIGEIGFETNDNNWFLVDLETQTLGDPIPSTGSTVIGADFDASGQLWTTAVGDGSNSLDITDPATGEIVESVGSFTAAGGNVEAVTVWGAAPLAPVLPATGPEATVPVGLGAALLLLAGAAFVATARGSGKPRGA
jgi:hypothetical protein